MSVATYQPASVFHQFQRDVDRLFNQQTPATGWTPSVDIREYDDRFVLRAEVAGIAPENVEITVDKNLLTISGERAAPAADDGQSHRTERSFGQFSRQFRLPETVNVDAVTATGEHGVLEITVPKAEQLQPRKITVNSAQ